MTGARRDAGRPRRRPRRRSPRPCDGPRRDPPTEPAILLERVSRWYGNVVAVNDITFALGARDHRPARPERRRQDDAPPHARGAPPAIERPGPRRRPVRPGGIPTSTDPIGLVPEREAVHPFLTGREFVELAARLQRLPDPAAAAARAIADGRSRSRRGPPDRHLLEGHAPAGEDRRRPRPRARDPAARRAVQRDGPAPAAAHDGSPPVDGRGRPDDPLLVAHPRGGRAARRRRPRHPRRPAGRGGRLPRDPAAHDRPTAHVPRPLVGRSPARRRVHGRAGGLRGGAPRRAA